MSLRSASNVAGVPTGAGQPGLYVSIGRSGSGKSYGQRQQIYRAARHHPIMVADTQGEWDSVPASLRRVTVIAPNVARAADLVKRGARIAIVQGDLSAAEEICAWAHQRFSGRRSDGSVRGVAIPEAHLVAPAGTLDRLTDAVRAVVTAWRHGRVAAWFDTQRFALLNRTVISQAVETRLHALNFRDMPDVSREFRSEALLGALEDAARRMRDGQPGWFVRLGVAPEPPFRLERE